MLDLTPNLSRKLGAHRVLPVVAVLLPLSASAASLRVEDAIRSAWQKNPGIAASAGQAKAARADADAARDAWWPALTLSAKALATDEPMAAFGLKMDEQKITAADFAPGRLNAPDPVGGVGLGASLVQPIYMGGRLMAGRRAAANQADAAASAHERGLQELAFGVVQAYFGAEVATDALRYADDVLQHAVETERFVTARNRQGLVLDADVARATAFRAQAEADRTAAAQRLASVRASLALLTGEQAGSAELVTPLIAEGRPSTSSGRTEAEVPEAGRPSTSSGRTEAEAPGGTEAGVIARSRPDVEAARSRARAAEEAVGAARGNILPEVMAQGSVETMRAALDQGATWFTVALVARWKLDLPDLRSTSAAQARASAASDALRWQELQAANEVGEAERAAAAAVARVASAREAVAASEAARTMRIARHRQGLLPLTDVLDAEAGLAGARALLLRSLLEARVARAQLQLALGEPIEGVRS